MPRSRRSETHLLPITIDTTPGTPVGKLRHPGHRDARNWMDSPVREAPALGATVHSRPTASDAALLDRGWVAGRSIGVITIMPNIRVGVLGAMLITVSGIATANLSGQSLEGRVAVAAKPDADGKLQILVWYDMEGLAGQSDWRTQEYRFSMVAGDLYPFVKPLSLDPVRPDSYALGQELLVADVNAIVDGLFAGGADTVDVIDSHGSGNPEDDLPSARLDRRARALRRQELTQRQLYEAGHYDAVVMVAQHTRSGGLGFFPHTRNIGTHAILNGRAVTETELWAYGWGILGVPVILVSGDDQLGRDLQSAMPWTEDVSVKKGPARYPQN